MFVTNLLLLEKKHHFFSVSSQLNKSLFENSDSFFPQMRPEKWDAPKGPELNDNEKLVFNALEQNNPIELNSLKEASGLSNKQWDKTVKSLRSKELINVEKNESGLFVSILS